MKRQAVLLTLVTLMCCVPAGKVWSTAAAANPCSEARSWFERSGRTADVSTQKRLLEKAVELCPNYAKALNNLGLIYESEKRLDEAARYYQQAISASPRFPHPYVGLADVLRKQGKYAQAAANYRKFLDLALETAIRDQYPELKAYVPVIENRLQVCEQHLAPAQTNSVAQADETKTLVTRDSIIATLSKKPAVATRGEAEYPRIAVPILFETGSYRISQRSRQQLEEIAAALSSAQLAGCRIGIEGHTDNVGDAQYNLRLSQHRARAVRDYLVSRYQMDPARFEVHGYGKTRPVASNATSWGRAKNRRVELVNLDHCGGETALTGVHIETPSPEALTPPPAPAPSPEPVTPPPPPLKLAILTFDVLNTGRRDDSLGRMVAEFVTTAAVNSGSFDIAERELLAKVMKEQELGQSGIVDPSEARKIGQMVGAQAVLTGTVSRFGNQVRIDARVIDVESGKVLAAADESTGYGNLDKLSAASRHIIAKLITRLHR